MRYLLITILPFFFFSSFETVQPEDISNSQLASSDSCRLSKIYRNGEICHVYHYDSMKKIIRIDTYELFFRNTKGTISDYVEFKYDNFGRLIELSAFNGQKDNFYCWTKRKFIYVENSLSEVEVYQINYKTKKLKLNSIRKHTYNSKGK